MNKTGTNCSKVLHHLQLSGKEKWEGLAEVGIEKTLQSRTNGDVGISVALS